MRKLDLPPDYSGFSVADTSGDTLSQELDGGIARTRLDVIGAIERVVTVQWTTRLKGYNYLREFYKEFVARDGEEFPIDLYSESSLLEEYHAVFLPNTFRLASQNGLTFVVQATLRIRYGATNDVWPAFKQFGFDPLQVTQYWSLENNNTRAVLGMPQNFGSGGNIRSVKARSDKRYFESVFEAGAQLYSTGLTFVIAVISVDFPPLGIPLGGVDASRPYLDYKSFSYQAGRAIDNVATARYNDNLYALTAGQVLVGETTRLAIDIPSGKVWLAREGSWLNNGDPEAGTGPIVTLADIADMKTLHVAVGVDQSNVHNPGITLVQLQGHFTRNACEYEAPKGFKYWDEE